MFDGGSEFVEEIYDSDLCINRMLSFSENVDVTAPLDVEAEAPQLYRINKLPPWSPSFVGL